MRIPLLSLFIGFTAFTFCPGVCPMDMDKMSKEHPVRQGLLVAHHCNMRHEGVFCELCGEQSGYEFSLPIPPSAIEASVSSAATFAFWAVLPAWQVATGIPPNLSIAGPPPAFDMIHSVVLRT